MTSECSAVVQLISGVVACFDVKMDPVQPNLRQKLLSLLLAVWLIEVHIGVLTCPSSNTCDSTPHEPKPAAYVCPWCLAVTCFITS